jgi:hypothetical protein
MEGNAVPLLDGNFTASCPGPMHRLFMLYNVKVVIVDEITNEALTKGVIINKVPHTTRVYENGPGAPIIVVPQDKYYGHMVPSRNKYTEAELDVFVDQMRQKIDACLQEEIANFEATALQAICR